MAVSKAKSQFMRMAKRVQRYLRLFHSMPSLVLLYPRQRWLISSIGLYSAQQQVQRLFLKGRGYHPYHWRLATALSWEPLPTKSLQGALKYLMGWLHQVIPWESIEM